MQLNFLTKFRIGSADSDCAGTPYILPHHPKRIVMFLSFFWGGGGGVKHRFWVGVYGDVEYGCMARQPAEEVAEEEVEEKAGNEMELIYHESVTLAMTV